MKKTNIFVTTIHCIVFVLNMGLGINIGFVIDQWFAPVFSSMPTLSAWGAAVPVGSVLGFLVALVSGTAIGFGAYGLFIHSEQAWKNIGRLAETDNERKVRRGALIAVNVFWCLIGILGLAYRLEFLNAHGLGFLFVIGSLLDLSQPLYGLILYPMIHIDADMLEEQQIEQFRSKHVGELYGKLGSLPLNQRHRAYMGLETGNEDEILDVLEEDIAAAQAREQMRQRRKPTRVLTRNRKARDDEDEGGTLPMPELPARDMGSFPQAQRNSR